MAALLPALLPACSEATSPDGATEAPSLSAVAGVGDSAVPSLAAGEWPAEATYAQMVGELGIQIDAAVPERDAEELFRLMSASDYSIKVIRSAGPGVYTINAWGIIPHAAVELTIRRTGTEWEVLRDESWVLIGDA